MNFKQLTRILLIMILLLIFLTKTSSESNLNNKEKCYLEQKIRELELNIDKINSLIIVEIESYMDFKKMGHGIDPELILEMCDKYNVDPRLLLVQGWLESHWGTIGMAARTNSVFNVGATGVGYEEIHDIYKYETRNHSIEPYVKLISERYLVDDRTEMDLLNNFVDVNNNRYAEATNYESALKIVWKEINETTKIDSLITARQIIEEEKLQFLY